MKDIKYQICTRCVMDVTDTEIIFDEKGVCNHCHHFDEFTTKRWFPNDEGKRKISTIFAKIKKKNKSQSYDCIIGLSGGLDSSYLALILKNYDLRPLVVHVDAGWNSELAVYNIEQIVKYCDYDLHTHVVNWEEVKDLQLAFLKSGVANQDAVQDHIFFATLYHFAVQHNIKYIISGGNISTEAVGFAVEHAAMDAIILKDIHRLFGKKKLSQYKTISFFEYFFYYPFIKGMEVVRPLNFMPYNKNEALKILKEKINYKEYERKHGESIFTKFFQNYYLPKKFNVDKRRSHFSSQILSECLTREKALRELQKPLYDEIEVNKDKVYIAKKLEITVDELDRFTFEKGIHYSKYANWDTRYKVITKVKKLVQKVISRNVKTYS